ncbi:MAG TPA: hypothetical protein VN803_06875 [Gemmatimonadales bacterium]|nr:hypothetical protein [Gemmatimonadales bacterium]
MRAGDAQRLADILEATIVAERMFMRLQFDADGDSAHGKAEIDAAQEARRNAIGLRKAIEKWPVTVPATT